jgi:hypothetical protein
VTYGGDPGNRIFVLYWRRPLIRVSVIRGSIVLGFVFCTDTQIPHTKWSYAQLSDISLLVRIYIVCW